MVNIYSSEYTDDQKKIIDFSPDSNAGKKQIINIGIALVFALIILLLNGRLFDTISYLIYAVAIALLLLPGECKVVQCCQRMDTDWQFSVPGS